MAESAHCTSVSLSPTGTHALVTTTNPAQVHLWDLRCKSILHSFAGFDQSRYVVRAVFGGNHSELILCGSEDSQVYVWHRESGEPLFTLGGHSGPVTSLACCPQRPQLFASAR